MKNKAKTKIRNVIICDDVRDELGNKRSLMGVHTGDMIVPSFPSQVQIAVYMDFVGEAEQTYRFEINLRLDDEIILKGDTTIFLRPNSNTGNIVLPKGIVTFEKETTLSVLVGVDGEPLEPIASTRVLLGNSVLAT